jgi:hypothetical protein
LQKLLELRSQLAGSFKIGKKKTNCFLEAEGIRETAETAFLEPSDPRTSIRLFCNNKC